jgi:2'-5' RNA ligase
MRPGEHVVYFALRPPPEAASAAYARLADAAARCPLTAAPTPAERLHVSVGFVCAAPAVPWRLVETACAAARGVRLPPFRVAFNRLGSWGKGDGKRAVVLWGDEGVIGVDLLCAALSRQLGREGRGPQIWPHMTLVRDRAIAPQIAVRPVTWEVREFVLISSLHVASRHEVLARFPLG